MSSENKKPLEEYVFEKTLYGKDIKGKTKHGN
jgi:hypothetical protein